MIVLAHKQLILTILLIGLGTYLMRAVPLLIAISMGRRERTGVSGQRGNRIVSTSLSLVGPAIISALLALSLVPAGPASNFVEHLIRNVIAAAIVCVVAARWRHVGLTVLTGIVSYWLVSLFL